MNPLFKRKSGVKQKSKVCTFPECGKVYVGHPISKYCKFHSDIKNRKVTTDKKIEGKEKSNKLIFHEVVHETKITAECKCCKYKFEVEIIPGQYIYPEFCPKHRNEYQRKFYNQNKSK